MNSAEHSKTNLRLISLNVRGLHDAHKRQKVFSWFRSQQADVIFLQETFCKENFAPYFNANWKGQVIHSFSTSSHSRGVCILFKESLNVRVISKHCSADERKIFVNVDIENSIFTLLCLYAPNIEKDRKIFFTRVNNWINRYAENKSNIITAGDLNCCIEDTDRTSKTHMSDKSRRTLKELAENQNLDDVWIKIKSTAPGYTFSDPKSGTKSRLDYFFMSKDCLLNVDNINLSVCPFVPDHLAVMLTTYTVNERKGNGYWKMNKNLLGNSEYKTAIENAVKEIIDESANFSKQIIWEIIKIKIKELSIKFSSHKASETKKKKQNIQDKLDMIEKKVAMVM